MELAPNPRYSGGN